MTNVERRDAGLAYFADEAVKAEGARCRRILQRLNNADWADFAEIERIAKELFGRTGERVCVTPPFFCDYGKNIEVGENFYANFNCTILDVAPVKIGRNCLLAPNVAIYTAAHPIFPDTRDSGYEFGRPVEIGDSVWIGGSSVVCPGVKIGPNTVIGAGSVVTRDIPAWSVAAGNPCRVIRAITEADRKSLFRRTEIDAEAWEKIAGAMR